MGESLGEQQPLFPLDCGFQICQGELARPECARCTVVEQRNELLGKIYAWREAAAQHFVRLTPQQRRIMAMVLDGKPSKNIAADLGISQRTVENHRAAVMKKASVKSIPELARLAMAASWSGVPDPD